MAAARRAMNGVKPTFDYLARAPCWRSWRWKSRSGGTCDNQERLALERRVEFREAVRRPNRAKRWDVRITGGLEFGERVRRREAGGR